LPGFQKIAWNGFFPRLIKNLYWKQKFRGNRIHKQYPRGTVAVSGRTAKPAADKPVNPRPGNLDVQAPKKGFSMYIYACVIVGSFI
jgi:hypothetical protein